MSDASPRTDHATPPAPNINTLWARALVDELARCGLADVCISPGSRSTPLVVQFYEHPEIRDHSIVDERSAAFFALGLARSTRRPVALLCTSGTAAANYFPAVCEAAASNIPLIVLTADRPPELHNCGASQAMDQHGLYGERVRWFHQVAQAEARAEKLRYIRQTACRAVAHATGHIAGETPGPVHLNIPFRKPLEPTAVAPDHPDYVAPELVESAPVATFGRPDARPFLDVNAGINAPGAAVVTQFIEHIARAKRPLFLLGADENGANYRDALRELAEYLGAPIAAEPTSGARHWKARGENVIAAADLIFSSTFYASNALAGGGPDLIIRLGRAPLLWAAQTLVRNRPEATQIVVGSAREIPDPDHLVDAQFICDEKLLFQAALKALKALTHAETARETAPEWLESHQAADKIAQKTLTDALSGIETLNSARFWDELGQILPENAALFVSNSMATRDLDTFMCRADGAIDLHFNRGLNGIDGIISSGLGVAMGQPLTQTGHPTPRPTALVLGDVALRHDLAALMLARELGLDATILVIDNAGGAIFDYLPIRDFDAVHQRHFITRPPVSMREMLPASVELLEPKTWPELRAAIADSLATPGLQLIRVEVDREFDKQTSDTLRRRISEAVAGQ